MKAVEERYRNYKGIPSNVALSSAQLKAVQKADDIYQQTGYEVASKTIDTMATINLELENEANAPKVKSQIARDLARGSVEARTDSINQAKSDFDAHTASLIKKYGKGVN